MNRRLFFRALAGAPVLAIPAQPKPHTFHHIPAPCCSYCQQAMVIHSLTWELDKQFVTCENPHCRMHKVALELARPEIETRLADPEYVRQTLEKERLDRDAWANRPLLGPLPSLLPYPK